MIAEQTEIIFFRLHKLELVTLTALNEPYRVKEDVKGNKLQKEHTCRLTSD